MKRMERVLCIVLAILFFFMIDFQASADVYKWVDEKGNIHFTENEDAIPEKYRDRVEKKPAPKEPLATQEKTKTKKPDEKEKDPKARPKKKQAQKPQMNVNRTESDVIDSMREIVSLWKDGKFGALYEYGSEKSRMAVAKEHFERRMAGKVTELASSWETIRDIDADVKSPSLAHVTVKLGCKPKKGGETRTQTMTYRMVLEKGMWRIDLQKILQALR